MKKYLNIINSIAFLLLIGALIALFSDYYHEDASVLFSMSGVMVFIAYIKKRSLMDGPIKDERTDRIGSYGLSYSWFFTICVLCSLYLLDNFKLIQLTTGQTLIFLLLVMLLTAKGSQWYLFKRGDV